MEELSYIQIRKIVEDAIPLTSDFDYTQITSDKMWERVETALGKAKVIDKLESTDLDSIRSLIISSQNSILEMKNASDNTAYVTEFDQCNYAIDSIILFARNDVMAYITKVIKCRAALVEYSSHSKYSEKLGTNEEIESLISREAIAEYLAKVFTITFEVGVQDEVELLKLKNRIVDDILYHFSLRDGNGTLGKFILEYLNKALNAASLSRNADGSQRLVDSSLYEKNMTQFMPGIIDQIQQITKWAYDGKLEEEKDHEQSKFETGFVEAGTSQDTKSNPTSAALQAAKEKFAKLQEAVATQQSLIESLEQIEKNINDTKKQLAEMETDRDRIIKELEDLQSDDNKGRK